PDTPTWRMMVDWAYLTLPTPRPVVLLHGYKGNPAGTWGGSPYDWTTTLRNQGYGPSVIVPALNSTSSVKTNAPLIQTSVEDTRSTFNTNAVDILAHSKGGLDASQAMSAKTLGPVRHLVELGTPNRGTPLADLGVLSPALREMSTLNGLRIASLWHDPKTQYTSIAGSYVPGPGAPAEMVLGWMAIWMLSFGANDGAVPVMSVNGIRYMKHMTFFGDS